MNKRTLIIESIGRPIEKDFSKTSVAHARNSVILADILNADIITCERDMSITNEQKYDNIICCYASPYMKYKKLIQVVRDNPDAKLWWLVNDHDLEDNILLRNVLKETNGNRKFNMICNNERTSYRGWILRKKIKNAAGEHVGILDDFIENWYTVNLNALIFSYYKSYKWSDKKFESIYYGTMRKHRLDDLKLYQSDKITLSATPRTQEKFIKAGIDKCYFVDKLSWQRDHEHLNSYKFSLYIEDIHTHDHYAFMANRFYEGLMFNVINIFDSKCAKNIEKSGYRIDPKFVVNSAEEYYNLVDQLSDQESFESALADNTEHIRKAECEYRRTVHSLQDLLGVYVDFAPFEVNYTLDDF
jgi:hypothetical protein